MKRSVRLSICWETSRSMAPAIWLRKPCSFICALAVIPERPARSEARTSSALFPMLETIPSPVTTTRRMKPPHDVSGFLVGHRRGEVQGAEGLCLGALRDRESGGALRQEGSSARGGKTDGANLRTGVVLRDVNGPHETFSVRGTLRCGFTGPDIRALRCILRPETSAVRTFRSFATCAQSLPQPRDHSEDRAECAMRCCSRGICAGADGRLVLNPVERDVLTRPHQRFFETRYSELFFTAGVKVIDDF